LSTFGALRTLESAQEIARQVQAAGFEGLWVPESARGVFPGCAAATLAAPTLPLGTGVAVAFARSPMLAAQEAWLLAEATGGRFVFGLGSQVRAHVERRYSAPFSPPGPRLREYVQAVRAIFRAFRGEERLAFEGDFYSFSLLPSTWSPGPIDCPDPPIYVAGVRPWMCRMIGETADGMLVHPLCTDAYLDSVVAPAVAEGAGKARRRPNDVPLVCPVMTAVSDDEEARNRQRESIRARIAFYGSTPGYGVVFDTSGWPGVGEELNRLQREGNVAAMMELVTDSIVDAVAITSTWDQLPARLLERYSGRASDVVCYSALEHWNDEPEARERWEDATRRFRELRAPRPL
jgi:probable F420-dependent oxidoreductase